MEIEEIIYKAKFGQKSDFNPDDFNDWYKENPREAFNILLQIFKNNQKHSPLPIASNNKPFLKVFLDWYCLKYTNTTFTQLHFDCVLKAFTESDEYKSIQPIASEADYYERKHKGLTDGLLKLLRLCPNGSMKFAIESLLMSNPPLFAEPVSEAVEFAEWIDLSQYERYNGKDWYDLESKTSLTTLQLYNLFKTK